MKKIITFIKYSIVSVSSAIVDNGLFALFFNIIGLSKLNATIIARIISSAFNYYLNRNTVFNNTTKPIRTIIKYYILAVAIMFASGYLLTFVTNQFDLNVNITKIIIDGVLFIASYIIQKNIIFKNEEVTKK